MKRRIVITGMGCVTPIGNTVDDFATALHSGHIGVGRLTLFDANRYPVRIAAEVNNWDLSQVGENPQQWRQCPRQTQFAIGAGLQAAEQSGLHNDQYQPGPIWYLPGLW